MQLNHDVNNLNLINKTSMKISDNCCIIITEFRKRKKLLYDVVFKNNETKKFIGRYPKYDTLFNVKYFNGKILVYGEEFNKKIGSVVITNVYELYNILDDCYYSLAEEEALKLFYPEADINFLKNKDRLIVRVDLEKIKRQKQLSLR